MKSPLAKVIIPIIALMLGVVVIYSQTLPSKRGGGSGSTTPPQTQSPADGSATNGETSEEPTTADDPSEQIDADADPDEGGEPVLLVPAEDEEPSVEPGDPRETDEVDSPPAVDTSGTEAWHFLRQPLPTGGFANLGTDGDETANPARMILEMNPRGAGIRQITLLDYFRTLEESPDNRYTLLNQIPDDRPALAVRAIMVNGKWLSATGTSEFNLWREEATSDPNRGLYVAEIADENGEVLFTISRDITIGPAEGQMTVRQSIRNHTDQACDVRLEQWGPSDLTREKSRYGDYRRFRFGYLDPRSTRAVLATEGEYLQQRAGLIGDRLDEGTTQIWPNETAVNENYTLSWVASTSRYFGFAVYPHLDDPATAADRAMQTVDEVHVYSDARQPDGSRYTSLNAVLQLDRAEEFKNAYANLKFHSPTWRVGPQQVKSFDLGGYAGPLDRPLFSKTQPYKAFNMRELVVYQLTCAFCTFQWLAHILIWFLRFIHDGVAGIGVHDWGLSIIILVLVVRTILHPLTKKGQVSMQKFSKKIQAIQPELKKLQEKYADNPKKMQQEQMRLYKENNVNPVGCLGMAPMFLQMPIWVALYAMLYFAIELRHQPAFYGLLQMFGNWQFLADLSQPDQFVSFGGPIGFLQGIPLLQSVEGINLLPILMGAIFYLQQKYMTPPNPNLTPEQETQQKIMRILFPVMFPLMLYGAPAGLTLYIMTSSCIGIIESRYIRAHVSALDLEAEKEKKPSRWRRWLQAQQEKVEHARNALEGHQHGARSGQGRGGGKGTRPPAGKRSSRRKR